MVSHLDKGAIDQPTQGDTNTSIIGCHKYLGNLVIYLIHQGSEGLANHPSDWFRTFYQACEGKDMSTKGVWIFVGGEEGMGG